MIAPLNAPIENSGDDIRIDLQILESFHDTALECPNGPTALQDKNGLIGDLLEWEGGV